MRRSAKPRVNADAKSWMRLPARATPRCSPSKPASLVTAWLGLLEVPETDCTVLIARGTSSVDDVDLFAYGEDGAVLGSDKGSDKAPALLVCPPTRAASTFGPHRRRPGLVAVGAQRVAVKDAEKAAALYGVRHRPGEDRAQAQRLAGPRRASRAAPPQHGAEMVDVRRVAVPLDSRMATRVSGAVEPERCLDVLVLPSDDVGYLDVTVLDERGSIVGRAPMAGRNRTLIVCSPAPAGVTVEIRPHQGMGLAVVMLSRTQQGTEQDSTRKRRASIPFDRQRGRHQGTRADAARARAPRWLRQPGSRAPEQHGVRSRARLLPHRPAGGAPLRGLEAWLWASDGSLIASERGGGGALLFACTRGGKVRLDVEALARGGPFAAEVLPEADAPAVLFDSPLAASRLIARMVGKGSIAASPEVGAVQRLSLDVNKLNGLDVKVPVGRCLEVTAALGPGASGIELRALGANNQELSLMRGSFSVSSRLCAVRAGETLQARVELRALSGSGEALLASRLDRPPLNS